MPATLLGTTGNFGIPQDEAGVIINDYSLDYSHQEKPVLNKSGDIIGMAMYQEVCDVKFSGLVPATSPFATKLAAALTVTNAIPDHLQGGVTGTTILHGVGRASNNEDFEKIDVEAKHYPLLTVVP